MNIYKPSELLKFLSSIDTGPKKSLSQNFLIDGNVIQKIVRLSEIQDGDVVLEIGPGPGALTEALLANGATVVAVEKDKVFANALHRLQTKDQRLHVFCDDILNFPIESHMKAFSTGKKARVVANLPYHLTTPILERLVKMEDTFSFLSVMVQQEVARRFTAKANTRDYSSFTVYLNFFSTPEYGFTVSKNCFYPVPKVESAIVLLKLKKPPEGIEESAFFKLTRQSFEHRRKMLRSSLKELYGAEAVTKSLQELGMNPEARPETLSLDNFIALFKKLHSF